MLTFFLVIKIMMPMTNEEKDHKSQFRKFLFNGFADKNELKAAFFAQNPQMQSEERSLMENSLETLGKLIETTETT